MDIWSFRKSYFFSPDMLHLSQHLLSNPDDCGALPTSNWHRFGSAQTWGYLWHHSHFIFSLSVFLSLPCLPLRSANMSATASVSLALAKLVPFSSAGFRHSARFVSFAGRRTHTSPLRGTVLLDILPQRLMTSEPPGKDKEGRWENTTSLSFLFKPSFY